MRAQGKADALDLRARAPELDGTAIIAEEAKIPQFDGSKDYSGWAVGSPVWEEVDGERQVFTLLQPHNASHYPGSTPSNTPALWSIRHTKDPKRAKRGWPPTAPAGSMSWTSAPRGTAMYTRTATTTTNSAPPRSRRGGRTSAPSRKSREPDVADGDSSTAAAGLLFFVSFWRG